jgi:serine/threonine-protein kinase
MEHIEKIGEYKIRLKESFDLKFINQFGALFWVLDTQSSGNLCFGVKKENKKYFIKFAGAKTINDQDLLPEDAIDRLKASVQKYKDMAHASLVNLIESMEIGNGHALVFEWEDGESIGEQEYYICDKFNSLPLIQRVNVFEEILKFQTHVAKCGYVAIDFNANNVLYNYTTGKVVICDIDFYAKQSYMNGTGNIFGVKTLMSPEEYRCAGIIDEITNVYTMGAMAFLILSKGKRSFEEWQLNKKLFDVVKKATNDTRKQRQQSIEQFVKEWNEAK